MLLLLGGLISLVSTTLFYIIQRVTDWALINKGKVKIYKKIVYSKIDGSSWGFHGNDNELNFSIPLWIEIQNTKDKKEVLRNMNLYLYRKNKKIGKMKQLNYFTKGNDPVPIYFADEGSYSFLVQPNSMNKFELYFSIRQNHLDIDFDEVRLGYYNTKDKYIEFKLLKIQHPWVIKNESIDDDWILLK